MASFPPSPSATFSILGKLDHCFASLLCGQDVETKETLPGFESGLRAGLTTTDMVRCKSIVEQTRVEIVDVMAKEPEEEGSSQIGNETEGGADGEDLSGLDIDEDDEFLMDVARVYEKTIVQLGERLGSSGIAGTDIEMGDDDETAGIS